MKKALISLLCLALLGGCAAGGNNVTDDSTDNEETIPFEVTTKDLDMEGYVWLEDEDPAFQQITMEESLRFYEEDGTGIVLYSYDTCPWCNRAVPILNEIAKEKNVQIYYVDIYEDEMMKDKSVDERKEIVDRLYADLDSILKKELNEQTGEMEPALYVPLVVAVRNGKIVDSHESLVESFHLESNSDQMNEDQKEELRGIYRKLIDSVY